MNHCPNIQKEDSENEDDDGFIVEHGYLSTDEGTKDDVNDDDEQRKERLAQRNNEWLENQRQKERRFKEKRVL